MSTVAVAGAHDRQLEDLLKAAGLQARALQLSEFSTLPSNRVPDVLVLDTRSGQGVPSTLPSIKRQYPALGVVIVASALDPELLLEAMRAGVNELVAEPITQTDLARAVNRVLGQHAGFEAGKIYGFVGAKGGVGTTTVAVNVAMLFARLNQSSRTLLIDMYEAGGDTGVFLSADPKFSISDVADNTHRLDDTYLNSVVIQLGSGLDLLGSADRSFPHALDPAKIRAVLDFVARAYRFVILDLPRFDAAVLDALDQATTIFIVANQELATVKDGARMATTLRQRFGKDKVKIVLSRADRQADIGPNDVERTIGAEVVHSFPSDYRTALQAINKGRPLVSDTTSELAHSYQKFVTKLAGHTLADRPTAPRGGFFNLLSRKS
ncbi:MAG: AAA family ATPase [Acidobacteriaceae bacterium]|nr:AAA family ATPase [Acidobacteriaceae bacterium]